MSDSLRERSNSGNGWSFIRELQMILHIQGCDECTRYMHHCLEARVIGDATMRRAIEEGRRFWENERLQREILRLRAELNNERERSSDLREWLDDALEHRREEQQDHWGDPEGEERRRKCA
jgi:hypothetical protein